MKIDKNYMRFKRWFKKIEISIHQGQWSDENIAYSAWEEGQREQTEHVTAEEPSDKDIKDAIIYGYNLAINATLAQKDIINYNFDQFVDAYISKIKSNKK
jgi:hypothetical protein